MNIELKKPVAYTEPGKKEINQDVLFTGKEGQTKNLYFICDGNGPGPIGKQAAEVLSATLADQFEKSLKPGDDPDQAFFTTLSAALHSALQRIPNPSKEPLSVGVALAYFGPGGLTLAATASCRAYLLSLNDAVLVKKWASAAEPSTDFVQFGPEGKFSRQFTIQTSIRRDDMIALLSQGFGEKVTEEVFDGIITQTDSQIPEGLLDNLRAKADFITQDNFSALILGIQKISFGVSAQAAALPGPISETIEPPRQQSGRLNWRLWALGISLLLLAGVAGWYWNDQQTQYKRLMAQGTQSLNRDEFDLAAQLFSQAQRAASFQSQRQAAKDAIDLTFQRKELYAMNALRDAGLVTGSAAEYLTQAELAFSASRFPEAAFNYRLAGIAKEAQNNKTLTIPQNKYAESLAWTAQRLFEMGNTNCELASQHIAEATTVMETYALTPTDTVLRSLHRLSISCKQTASAYLEKQIALLDSRQANPGQTGRRVGPADKQIAQSTLPPGEGPETNPTARVPKQQPANNLETSRGQGPAVETQAASAKSRLSALETGKAAFRNAMNEKTNQAYQEARKQLLAAGSQLDGEGAYMLAYLYHMGLGVKKNEDTALSYARKSALQDWPSGQFLYGALLVGRPSKIDKQNGIAMLRKSADNGHFAAVEKLRALGEQWP